MKQPFSLTLLGAVTGLILASLPQVNAQTAPATPDSAAAPAGLDFGNFTSETIVGKAWQALNSQNYNDVLGYTNKCIEMYQKQALEMQKSLTDPVPVTDKEKVFSMWALNDVGVAYFIKAQTLEKLGKPKEALEAYKFLAENLRFAQCWDPKGWFWKPAGAAAERVKALEFDTAK